MSLYTRNHRPSMGSRTGIRIQTGEGLSKIMQDSPLSSLYKAPITTSSDDKNKTKQVWLYMCSVQTRQYGQAIDISDSAKRLTQRHVKQALKRGYTYEYMCRAIRYASTISRFPFTLPFALRYLDETGCQHDRFRPNTQSGKRTTGTSPLFDP